MLRSYPSLDAKCARFGAFPAQKRVLSGCFLKSCTTFVISTAVAGKNYENTTLLFEPNMARIGGCGTPRAAPCAGARSWLENTQPGCGGHRTRQCVRGDR